MNFHVGGALSRLSIVQSRVQIRQGLPLAGGYLLLIVMNHVDLHQLEILGA